MNLLDLDNLALSLILDYASDDYICMSLVVRHVCKRLRDVQSQLHDDHPWCVCTTPSALLKSPAVNGELCLVLWLNEFYDVPTDISTFKMAAVGGHIHVLSWLWWPFGYRLGLEEVVAKAAQYGQIETIKWLRANGAPWDHSTYSHAVIGGQLPTVKWLTKHKAPCDTKLDRAHAAMWGHPSILEFFWSNDCTNWWPNISALAAREGHIPVLEWYKNKGFSFCEYTFEKAATGGHIETMEWLKANGVPMGKLICFWAVKYGQLDALKWLKANGAHWDPEEYLQCIEMGDMDHIRNWIESNF